MDDDFRMLFDYVEQMKRELQDKADLQTNRLRDMKIDSGFKNLNYAICVMCILEGDEQAEQQVRPHLPRSDVDWARSLHLLSPVPEIFLRNWLRNLLKPTRRDLSDRQKKRFTSGS